MPSSTRSGCSSYNDDDALAACRPPLAFRFLCLRLFSAPSSTSSPSSSLAFFCLKFCASSILPTSSTLISSSFCCKCFNCAYSTCNGTGSSPIRASRSSVLAYARSNIRLNGSADLRTFVIVASKLPPNSFFFSATCCCNAANSAFNAFCSSTISLRTMSSCANRRVISSYSSRGFFVGKPRLLASASYSFNSINSIPPALTPPPLPSASACRFSALSRHAVSYATVAARTRAGSVSLSRRRVPALRYSSPINARLCAVRTLASVFMHVSTVGLRASLVFVPSSTSCATFSRNSCVSS
mmetsp:Transcript_6730/g.27051  ORF Transcript_6730/g.27051 Transcript_6730/m.27051 type:complete len:298 (+) Transcript_6730:427-1320(+)